MQPVPGVYRASYQGCGRGTVVPVTSLFSQCRLLLMQDVFFSSLFVCLMQHLSNQTLVITIFVRFEVIKLQCINSGISRK